MKTIRFLVISRDEDNCDLRDFISVDGDSDNPHGDAMAIVSYMRPYAMTVCALTVNELRITANSLERSDEKDCRPFREQVADLTEARCIALLESISEPVHYGAEAIQTLRERVRVNLVDGTLNAEQNDLYIK